MEKYVSGIRPSGKLHLGNYLGVIKACRALYDSGKNCTFFVANMHGQYSKDDIVKTLIALQRCGLNSRSLRLQRSGNEIRNRLHNKANARVD